MNKLSRLNLIISGVVMVAAIVAVTLLATKGSSSANALDCSGHNSISHTVVIKGDYASPEITEGHICDKITFIDDDHVTREISFGPHENHVAYDGISEKVLNYKQSLTVTLNKTGTYDFHDHIHDTAVGNFIVSN